MDCFCSECQRGRSGYHAKLISQGDSAKTSDRRIRLAGDVTPVQRGADIRDSRGATATEIGGRGALWHLYQQIRIDGGDIMPRARIDAGMKGHCVRVLAMTGSDWQSDWK